MKVKHFEGFLTCRLPASDLAALRSLAGAYGLSRSEALRRVIRAAAANRGLMDELDQDEGEVQRERAY